MCIRDRFPPIEPLRPPAGAPNVLLVLLDDVGFGASSAFGGPCNTPTFEKLIECEPTDRVELDGDAPAVLAFTSGTAGSPKPAILSHAALSRLPRAGSS